MLRKWRFGLMIVAVLSGSGTAQAFEMDPGTAARLAKGAGGLWAAKKGAKTASYCVRHPLKCTVTTLGTVAVGAVVLSEMEKNRCDAIKPIYRLVDSMEYVIILQKKGYSVDGPYSGAAMETKLFWHDMANALWFEAKTRDWARTHPGPRYIVTSKICADTLAMATHHFDGSKDHPFLGFERGALSKVNSDARRSGGINTVKKFNE